MVFKFFQGVKNVTLGTNELIKFNKTFKSDARKDLDFLPVEKSIQTSQNLPCNVNVFLGQPF